MRAFPRHGRGSVAAALLRVPLLLTFLLFLLLACATMPSRQRYQSSAADVAGEWVDLLKTTDRDTMVWVLADGGNDQLLPVSLDAAGRHVTRRHFGRWSVVPSADPAVAMNRGKVRSDGLDEAVVL